MGLTDIAGSVIDKAAGALAGDGAAPRPEKKDMTFEDGGPLDPPNPDEGIIAGPNSDGTPPNPKNTPPMLEFVHFGKYHNDPANHYSHDKFDNEPEKKPLGRAILFRDAVEREMILMHGFITSTQTVHTELKKNRGPAGDIAGAIGKLTGGGGGTEPDPASFKFLLDDITTAGDTINVQVVDYPKVHKAGIDLHQVRTDYRAFCKDKMDKFYLHPDDSGPATLMALPAVAGAAKTVFGILFKAFDLYLAMFLALRDAYEPEIEKACYKFSLETVKGYKTHTFAPWYPAPKKKEDKKDDGGDDPFSKTIGKATKAIDKITSDINDVLGKPSTDQPPGMSTLNTLFVMCGSAESDDRGRTKPPPAPKPGDAPKIKAADELVTKAFAGVLKKDDLGFLDKIIGKIVWANVEFLRALYTRLLKNGPNQIDQKWLDETAHNLLFDKVFGLAYETFDFLNTARDASVQGLGPAKLIDKGQDALKQKVGPYADSVITLATGKLAEVLENIRLAAAGKSGDKKSMTMEVYLGALPYLLALQVRNTLFPVWELLITDLLGKGNVALDTALKPIRNMIGDARNIANSAKTMKDRLDKLYDATKTDSGNTINQDSDFGRFKRIMEGAEDAVAPKPDSSKGGKFPGGTRITPANATEVKESVAKSAKSDRKGKGWPTT